MGTAIDVATALYPGSYVDIAPSFVFPTVVYVDTDRRAAKFFDDHDGVAAIVAKHSRAAAPPAFSFVAADYTDELPLPVAGYDLLISLYAGPISRHCTHHLRVGGWLLVNPSHGDAALAALDPRYELDAVVHARAGSYRSSRSDLDTFLLPVRPTDVTVESVLAGGRGVAYTRSAFAYLFRRVG